MCVNKVFVRDLLPQRHFRRGSYFACGRCSACRQHLANSRANKIRSHEHAETTPYFVHLTYDDRSLPYVRREDLYQASLSLAMGSHDDISVNIYRDSKYKRSRRSVQLVSAPGTVIGKRDLIIPFSSASLDTYFPLDTPDEHPHVLGIRKYYKDLHRFHYDDSKISISFTPDFQNFIKRLRSYLSRNFSSKRLSFYSAPEYGPTSYRAHFHFILWLDSFLTKCQIESAIVASWPLCDEDLLKGNINVAHSAASYAASYVNCPTSIPREFLVNFPLRSSHSLHFGFNSGSFSLSSIISRFIERRSCCYPVTVPDEFGRFVTRDFLLPKYVSSRFFPKVKGFSRIAPYSLFNVYTKISSYLRLDKSRVVTLNKHLEPVYNSYCRDVYDNPISYTEKELNLVIRSLERAMSYAHSVGLSWFQYVRIIIDFYTVKASYLYRSTQRHHDAIDNILEFFNLPDVVNGSVQAPTVLSLLQSIPPLPSLNCNSLPSEVRETDKLIHKFDKYFKKRKLYSL